MRHTQTKAHATNWTLFKHTALIPPKGVALVISENTASQHHRPLSVVVISGESPSDHSTQSRPTSTTGSLDAATLLYYFSKHLAHFEITLFIHLFPFTIYSPTKIYNV